MRAPPQILMVTLYCHSGNEAVLSIDPNALAIIILLHWYEIEFEIVACSHFNESPTKQLPAIKTCDGLYSGYSAIMRALKDSKMIPSEEEPSLHSLTRREFLLQLNQELLAEEFNNDDVFRNFTEPALLTAKSRYYWNFACSRIFPLNNQVKPCTPASLKLNLKQKIEELLKMTNDQDLALESRLLLFSHLMIRFQLPKQHQFARFERFFDSVAAELETKEFKGKRADKYIKKPVYRHQIVEEYTASSSSLPIAYTGLFGVVLAVAVLYTLKNR